MYELIISIMLIVFNVVEAVCVFVVEKCLPRLLPGCLKKAKNSLDCILIQMFSFTTNPTIVLNFDGLENRPRRIYKVQGQDAVELPVYGGQETVSGVVDITVPPGKKIEHQGIRIELIGQTGKYCNIFVFLIFHFIRTFCRIIFR